MFLHNRSWGWKANRSSCASSGGAGNAIDAGGEVYADGYVLIQDNIAMTSANGITVGKKGRVSIVGNIVYDIHHASIEENPVGISFLNQGRKEAYFNTIVDSAYGVRLSESVDDDDVRCNLWLALPFRYGSQGFNSTSDLDNSACYDTDECYETPGRIPDGPEVSLTVAPWSEGAKSVGERVHAEPENGFVYRLMSGANADTSQPRQDIGEPAEPVRVPSPATVRGRRATRPSPPRRWRAPPRPLPP